MAGDATNVGNVYLQIRADIKRLSQDLASAERAAKDGAERVQAAVDRGVNFDKLKTAAVAAGGALYAAFASVSRAIDAAEIGAKIEKQATAFASLSAAAGTSSAKIVAELKRASRGMVAEADLMQSAGKAMLMGIRPDEITKLMRVAAATTRMTGQTMTEAFNDITLGVARQSRMILDNLGIIVDVDRANQDYAKSLGKTAEALTDAEKRQAFMNAVLKSGEDMVKRLGDAQGDLEGVNKLVAAQKNLWDSVAGAIASMLDKELAAYARIINWIDEKLKGMRASAGDNSRADLLKEIEMLRSLEAKSMAQPGSAWAKQAEYARRFGSPSEAMAADERRAAEWRKPDQYASWREREGQWFENTKEQNEAAVKERERWLKEQQDRAQKAADETKRQYEALAEEVRKARGQFDLALMGGSRLDEYMAGGQHDNAILRMHQENAARLDKEALAQGSEAMIADQRAYDEWRRRTEESFNLVAQLSERTAERMQDNFSDLFFDAFKGELKSLEDYANAIFDSILRAAADLAGQMTTQAIFGSKAVGNTAGGAGLLGSIIGMFGGGGPEQLGQYNAKGNAFGPAGMVAFARGGVVDRPTVFPFASGVGLMGEAGPEAIIPLKRNARGELGVSGAKGAVNITVNNYSGAPVDVRESAGPADTRQIEVMIGNMLSNGGPATQALRRYGLRNTGR